MTAHAPCHKQLPATSPTPRRFIARWRRRQELRETGRTTWIARWARVTAGTSLILMGLAIGWLPGPGFIPLVLAGGVLLAGESSRVACALDRGEEWLRSRATRMRSRQKAH